MDCSNDPNVQFLSETFGSRQPETVADALEAVYENYNCNHPKTELRKRTLRNFSVELRHQCIRCGDAVGNAIPKNAVRDYTRLNEFDIALQQNYETARSNAIQAVQEAKNTKWWQAYSNYLKTEKWKRKRAKVMQRAKGVCEGCLDEKAVEVHHLTYKHVGNELLYELVALCDACHKLAHKEDLHQ